MMTLYQFIASLAVFVYGTTSIFVPVSKTTHKQLFLSEDSINYAVVDCTFVDGVCECGNTEPKPEPIAVYTPKPKPTVETYYNYIPQNVRNSFEANGGTIIKSSTKLYLDEFPGVSLLAYINYESNTIYIDNRDSANSSVIHEIGHWIDSNYPFYSGDLSNSEEWLNIYNQHWMEWYTKNGGVKANYEESDEGFAECFQIYILNPGILSDDVKAYFNMIVSGF